MVKVGIFFATAVVILVMVEMVVFSPSIVTVGLAIALGLSTASFILEIVALRKEVKRLKAAYLAYLGQIREYNRSRTK